MGTFIHLVCIAAAALAILAHPAVAQGTNTTLPLTYPGRVLQGDGSQTCPSEEQREIVRNEVKNATRSLLHDSVYSTSNSTQPANLLLWWIHWLEMCSLPQYVQPLPAMSLCVAGDHYATQGVWKKKHPKC